MPKSTETVDIAIVGGGIIGLIAALSFSRLHLKVALIEQHDPEILLTSDAPKDGRSYAFAPSSAAFLTSTNLWHLFADTVSPIQEIRVVDNHSPFFLHFGEDIKDKKGEPLGYMLAADDALKTLWKEVLKDDTIQKYTKLRVDAYEAGPNKATLSLSNGTTLSSRLIIATDGRHSRLRDMAEIPITQHDYHQTAIIGVVEHALSHQQIAVEHFFPEGPFASLPLKHPHHSGIVWSERPEQASILMTLNKDDQLSYLRDKFGDHWGKITLQTALKSYPLTLCYASTYHAPRLLLLGDSAHAIHPLAGQGLNLAIRDMATLLPLIQECIDLGIDIADSHLGQRYTTQRRSDNMLMIALTHCCNAAYSNNFFPLKLARRLSMRTLHYIKPLKQKLQHYAMGK